MTHPSPVRLVLVGFMGSGKTSVGRALSERLGWDFVDLDDEIAAQEGMSVPEIFGSLGEAYFRKVEADAATAVLARRHVVVAPGGGWAAVPGRLAGLPDETVSVWLAVTPQEAVRRTATAPGSRPLLTGGDLLGLAERLIAERSPYYAEATFKVDTDGLSVEDVSARTAQILASSVLPESPE